MENDKRIWLFAAMNKVGKILHHVAVRAGEDDDHIVAFFVRNHPKVFHDLLVFLGQCTTYTPEMATAFYPRRGGPKYPNMQPSQIYDVLSRISDFNIVYMFWGLFLEGNKKSINMTRLDPENGCFYQSSSDATKIWLFSYCEGDHGLIKYYVAVEANDEKEVGRFVKENPGKFGKFFIGQEVAMFECENKGEVINCMYPVVSQKDHTERDMIKALKDIPDENIVSEFCYNIDYYKESEAVTVTCIEKNKIYDA